MGLAISVGVLACGPDADPEGVEWNREPFRHVNRVLAENDLPPNEEPESLPAFPYRHPCWIERKVWHSMFGACRYSVAYKCAVVDG